MPPLEHLASPVHAPTLTVKPLLSSLPFLSSTLAGLRSPCTTPAWRVLALTGVGSGAQSGTRGSGVAFTMQGRMGQRCHDSLAAGTSAWPCPPRADHAGHPTLLIYEPKGPGRRGGIVCIPCKQTKHGCASPRSCPYGDLSPQQLHQNNTVCALHQLSATPSPTPMPAHLVQVPQRAAYLCHGAQHGTCRQPRAPVLRHAEHALVDCVGQRGLRAGWHTKEGVLFSWQSAIRSMMLPARCQSTCGLRAMIVCPQQLHLCDTSL